MALSPMMQHYLNTKEQYKDSILMYRLGDFYEMFFDDAVTVSKELELTLTGRDCGLEERADNGAVFRTGRNGGFRTVAGAAAELPVGSG